MDANTILTQVKSLGARIEEFVKRLDTSDNALIKVGDRIDTVEGTLTTFRGLIGSLEDQIKARSGNLLPGIEDEVKKNGGINPVSALLEPNSRDASIAKEYSEKRRDIGGEQRATMKSTDDDKGAIFIPKVALPGYIDLIRERSLLWRSGEGPRLTVMNDLNGFPVEIPRLTDDVTVQVAAETEAPTESEIGTDFIKFEPRAIKSLTKLSRRLRRMAPLAAQVVQMSATKRFALEIDRQGFRGTGTDKEALGVVNTPGILSLEIGTNGGDFTLMTARAMKHKLRKNNVQTLASAGYIGHPDVFYTMMTERIAQYSGQTNGEYVFLPMSDQQLKAIIGPYWDSTLFPTDLSKGSGSSLTECIYGNWEDLWLGIWEDLTFSLSDQAGDSFEKSEVWIKSEMEIDFRVAQPLSFVLVNDANSVDI